MKIKHLVSETVLCFGVREEKEVMNVEMNIFPIILKNF